MRGEGLSYHATTSDRAPRPGSPGVRPLFILRILIEGIHGLNPSLLVEVPPESISASTCPMTYLNLDRHNPINHRYPSDPAHRAWDAARAATVPADHQPMDRCDEAKPPIFAPGSDVMFNSRWFTNSVPPLIEPPSSDRPRT
jgi:hypothetical protein